MTDVLLYICLLVEMVAVDGCSTNFLHTPLKRSFVRQKALLRSGLLINADRTRPSAELSPGVRSTSVLQVSMGRRTALRVTARLASSLDVPIRSEGTEKKTPADRRPSLWWVYHLTRRFFHHLSPATCSKAWLGRTSHVRAQAQKPPIPSRCPPCFRRVGNKWLCEFLQSCEHSGGNGGIQ